ncbi:MAG: hypothetical protein H8D43_03420, partial [Chloroflexi bacterium]|nr:hypothetical protein [Chloroflexota bacterium]
MIITPVLLPAISTHNHFVFDTGGKVLNRHAQLIKLPLGTEEANGTPPKLLTAVLNTNTVCFYLKQVCFNKKPGNDPVRDNWEFSGNYVALTPIPQGYEADTPNRRRMLALAEEMIGLAGQFPALTMRKLFEKEGEAYHAWSSSLDGYLSPHPDLPPPFTSARKLR